LTSFIIITGVISTSVVIITDNRGIVTSIYSFTSNVVTSSHRWTFNSFIVASFVAIT
jgi:hypothetical protein